MKSTHLALVKNYANPNDPRLAGESECHLVPAGSLIEEGTSYLSTRTRVSGLSPVSYTHLVGYIDSDQYPYAISVLVENGGSGGSVAAPVARQVFEYLRDNLPG